MLGLFGVFFFTFYSFKFFEGEMAHLSQRAT